MERIVEASGRRTPGRVLRWTSLITIPLAALAIAAPASAQIVVRNGANQGVWTHPHRDSHRTYPHRRYPERRDQRVHSREAGGRGELERDRERDDGRARQGVARWPLGGWMRRGRVVWRGRGEHEHEDRGDRGVWRGERRGGDDD